MINSRFEAWMNGEALSSISPNLFITEIKYTPAEPEIRTIETVRRMGEHIESVKWKGAKVDISFILRKTTETERQNTVAQAAAWAQGGFLQISSRPGQRLHTVCIAPPYVPDECKWTDVVTMTMQTFQKPFWEELNQAEVTLNGTSGEGTLYVPGNIGEALTEVTAAPTTGTLNNITVTVGNTTITLNGVNATVGEPLTIAYDNQNILSIRRGNTSVMDKRTGGSADDLRAGCGKNNGVSFNGSVNTTVRFTARGAWI